MEAANPWAGSGTPLEKLKRGCRKVTLEVTCHSWAVLDRGEMQKRFLCLDQQPRNARDKDNLWDNYKSTNSSPCSPQSNETQEAPGLRQDQKDFKFLPFCILPQCNQEPELRNWDVGLV